MKAITNQTAETWRIIADAPDYQVSNLGNVRNGVHAKRAILAGNVPVNMVPFKNGGGYFRIKVENRAGRLTNVSINRAVAFAFMGAPAERSYVVNHLNNDKTDNRLVNLEWISASENARRGTLRPRRAKLSPEVVQTMRTVYADTQLSLSAIARSYNMNVTALSNIIKRVTYASVQ